MKGYFLTAMLCLLTAVSQVSAQQTDAVSEDELVAAAERMIAQEQAQQQEKASVPVETTANADAASSEARKESEIPAFKNSPTATKVVETGSWQRILMSAAVVLILGFGLFYGVQRFAKKRSTQNEKLKMDVIAQHHFTPKRSLLVVRVAGEHLLIGATDHSMNLIKSISLIDDEADGNLPQDFNNFLEDEFISQPLANKGRTFTA